MNLSEFDISFIQENINNSVEKLLLQNPKKHPTNISQLAEQIKARQKIKDKLPTWFANFNLLMPKSISLEQSSSEITAKYKANLVAGQTLVDITGGMGVDFFALSKNFKEAIYIEQNTELKEIARYNASQLGVENASFISGNSVDFIENFSKKIDWIYLDPARRNQTGGKVFSLGDCEPNILNIKKFLLEKADNILLKASPMLDIEQAVNQLENVTSVHIISVENEVKELLFTLSKQVPEHIKIKTVQIKKDRTHILDFVYNQEKMIDYQIGPPQKYLYEPHAGIMKAGFFKTISQKFACKKLHQNTHLYTSDEIITDFPGRTFEVLNVLKADKKEVKNHICSQKANISVRNYPATIENLKKKLSLSDGGDIYLFACTDNFNQKIILHTTKIN